MKLRDNLIERKKEAHVAICKCATCKGLVKIEDLCPSCKTLDKTIDLIDVELHNLDSKPKLKIRKSNVKLLLAPLPQPQK